MVVYAAVWALSLFGAGSPAGGSAISRPPANPARAHTPLSGIQRLDDEQLIDQNLVDYVHLNEL